MQRCSEKLWVEIERCEHSLYYRPSWVMYHLYPCQFSILAFNPERPTVGALGMIRGVDGASPGSQNGRTTRLPASCVTLRESPRGAKAVSSRVFRRSFRQSASMQRAASTAASSTARQSPSGTRDSHEQALPQTNQEDGLHHLLLLRTACLNLSGSPRLRRLFGGEAVRIP